MKKHTIPGKYNRSKQPITAKSEEGMTMVIALLMGTVLLAGTTGLMVRQIMARKLGASESYQQMAETAALNGFNAWPYLALGPTSLLEKSGISCWRMAYGSKSTAMASNGELTQCGCKMRSTTTPLADGTT